MHARYPALMRALPGRNQRKPPGPAPVQRGAAATDQRRRILRVAADLVAKRGYADTSTDLIVRRAKVGYGTFYKFFPDKEAAFVALFDDTFERTSAVIADAYRPELEAGRWADGVAAALASFYREIASDPPLWRTCLVESLTAGPAILQRYEGAIGQLGALLKAGRQESSAAAGLPDSLESTLAGGIVWFAYQRLIVGEGGELMDSLPEAVRFALTPYIGERSAVTVASRAG
jgi:AcrR family transcriptional regulator